MSFKERLGRAIMRADSQDLAVIEELCKQRKELLEALKRFTAYGKVFAYKAGEQCPYDQAVEAITNTEATK